MESFGVQMIFGVLKGMIDWRVWRELMGLQEPNDTLFDNTGFL